MDFTANIPEFLKINNKVSLSGFGTFFIKNSAASVGEKGESILPPGKEISFLEGDGRQSDDFAKFIAEQNNTTVFEAEIEIKKAIISWNSKLEKEGNLYLPNLGTFKKTEAGKIFSGDRLHQISPDFYGLEEINISDIKNSENLKTASSKKFYRINNSLWWVLLVILGVWTVSYFAITQPEKIFGEKSFGKTPLEKAIIKTEKKPVKKDTVIQKQDNSLIITDTVTRNQPIK